MGVKASCVHPDSDFEAPCQTKGEWGQTSWVRWEYGVHLQTWVGVELSWVGVELSSVGVELSSVGEELSSVGVELSWVGMKVSCDHRDSETPCQTKW